MGSRKGSEVPLLSEELSSLLGEKVHFPQGFWHWEATHSLVDSPIPMPIKVDLVDIKFKKERRHMKLWGEVKQWGWRAGDGGRFDQSTLYAGINVRAFKATCVHGNLEEGTVISRKLSRLDFFLEMRQHCLLPFWYTSLLFSSGGDSFPNINLMKEIIW